MISLARIIESWRDAQIFKDLTAPRGKLWHFLKYPQYFLLISSALTYFLIIQDIVLAEPSLWRVDIYLVLTVGAVLVDVAVAYCVFEFFLDYFRTGKLKKDRLARLLNSNQKDMGSGS